MDYENTMMDVRAHSTPLSIVPCERVCRSITILYVTQALPSEKFSADSKDHEHSARKSRLLGSERVCKIDAMVIAYSAGESHKNTHGGRYTLSFTQKNA